MIEQEDRAELIEVAADIVSAYVRNNTVPAASLPGIIADVHRALHNSQFGEQTPVPEPQKPAVSRKRSVFPDYIICLEDGEKFRSLKRHLRTVYNMSPDQYRAKWGLADDYPMVAPDYSVMRSDLAKKLGLGRLRRKS